MNGSAVDFAQAVKAAYDDMGLSPPEWIRIRPKWATGDVKTIKDIQNEVAVVERYLMTGTGE